MRGRWQVGAIGRVRQREGVVGGLWQDCIHVSEEQKISETFGSVVLKLRLFLVPSLSLTTASYLPQSHISTPPKPSPQHPYLKPLKPPLHNPTNHPSLT